MNATAPDPVRNRDLARSLGRVLRRPSKDWYPSPTTEAGDHPESVLESRAIRHIRAWIGYYAGVREANGGTLSAEIMTATHPADLKPEGKKALDNVVEQAKALKVEVIVAVGYTDRIGSDADNLKLSQHRANSVKAYLVTKGIPADKVYTEGKGKANPVTGTTCNKIGGAQDGSNKKLVDCLQPDRRAVLEIIGTK